MGPLMGLAASAVGSVAGSFLGKKAAKAAGGAVVRGIAKRRGSKAGARLASRGKTKLQERLGTAGAWTGGAAGGIAPFMMGGEDGPESLMTPEGGVAQYAMQHTMDDLALDEARNSRQVLSQMGNDYEPQINSADVLAGAILADQMEQIRANSFRPPPRMIDILSILRGG